MPSTVWTPVALARDLPPRLVIPVTCNDQDLALWRSESGKVQAWIDRCPHRGMRLSHGFVRGELLSCIYHGWRYDGAGICRKIPAHPDLEPPATIRTTAWRCHEQDGVIWIAPQEDSENADLPPALPGLDALRSIPVQATVAQIAAACAQPKAMILTHEGLTLLAQPGKDGTVLHALIAAETATPADRIKASRALETLRLQIEATVSRSAA
ncbi:Rieske (2Fe-2S) protein [Paracoccus sp. (in: a-proteobacteria)]|uniref:Rieske (2Fe-2S) protein n=1 Tax=Paracoccus sp. TaxID=267 RepID=UPI00289A11BE|nr:Rieske (2Fe-2S) protein [Paracoccus sp. (in: a-proteobacteria)]